LRPSWNVTASSTRAPGCPFTSTCGAAHGDPRSQRGRGSHRGERLADGRLKQTSSGVRLVRQERAVVRNVRRAGRHPAALRRQAACRADTGRCLWTVDHRRQVFVQFPRRLEENVSLLLSQDGQIAQVAPDFRTSLFQTA
jgi:hypothetical protein